MERNHNVCITNCDSKDYSNYNSSSGFVNIRTSVYEAKIPETEESMNVQFYAWVKIQDWHMHLAEGLFLLDTEMPNLLRFLLTT